MSSDQFGLETSGEASSVEEWDRQVSLLMMMRGNFIEDLDRLSTEDESFAMGSVLNGAYRIIGGAIPDSAPVLTDLSRARDRATGEREGRHVTALAALVAGEFDQAAEDWYSLVADFPTDIVATRLGHDVSLHVGNRDLHLATAQASLRGWSPGDGGYGWALGMYSFALEEQGQFWEAEEAGLAALEINFDDAWALHALSHVYEHADGQEKALALMESNQGWWSESNLLSNHIWWHLAIRLIEDAEFDRCLAIVDDQVAEAVTGFALSDLSSLLWRLELAGCAVGDRWDRAADRWSQLDYYHTCGFLDLHAAMALSTDEKSEAAVRFLDGVETPHYRDSLNGTILTKVAPPLVKAVFEFRRGNYAESARLLGATESKSILIGGSNAQREVLNRTRAAALERSDPAAAEVYLNQLLNWAPGRVWIERSLESLTPGSSA